MKDFELVKASYLKLRVALIKYLEKFDEESYYYQPTDKSNSPAWIVPHIVAFEKVMVVDKIEGYEFEEFISQKNVDLYKPGVDGFAFRKGQLMTKEEAIILLSNAHEVSINFLDNLINLSNEISKVNQEIAFDKYLLNFSHETEHYGQLKYLIGTWMRTRKEM